MAKITNRQLWTTGLLYGDPTKLGAHEPSPRRANYSRERIEVQTPVIKFLRSHPKVAWVARINSGAYRTQDGRYIRFGFTGCSDIIGQLKDGRFLAIECKAASEGATDEQQKFIDHVNANGGRAGVARSINDAKAIIES